MSITYEIDLLIMNMIIFSRLDALFPVKVAKMSKLKKRQITEYIDIVLSDLVIFLFSHFKIILLYSKD